MSWSLRPLSLKVSMSEIDTSSIYFQYIGVTSSRPEHGDHGENSCCSRIAPPVFKKVQSENHSPSSTVFMFSIQIASTGPSKYTHLTCSAVTPSRGRCR